MKTKLIKSSMLLAGVSTLAVGTQAQDNGSWMDRLGLGYHGALNITAKFSGLGGFTSLNTPGVAGATADTAAPGTVVRTYDDGFIGVDNSQNAGGTSTYWGYNNSSQVVGGAIQMHSSSSPATASTGNVGNEIRNGIELSYFQPLGGSNHWRWGVDGALNWTPISVRDTRPLLGDIITLTHAFDLGGVTPPPVPPNYVGPVAGPGAPQLGTGATDLGTTTQTGAASIVGRRSVEANLFGLRVGPYLEYDLCRTVSFDLGAGFAGSLMDSKFSYDDVVTISGLGSQVSSGADHSLGFIYGGYVRGQVNLKLCKSATLFGGAELDSLNDFTQSAGVAHAQINLGTIVNVTGGIRFRF